MLTWLPSSCWWLSAYRASLYFLPRVGSSRNVSITTTSPFLVSYFFGVWGLVDSGDHQVVDSGECIRHPRIIVWGGVMICWFWLVNVFHILYDSITGLVCVIFVVYSYNMNLCEELKCLLV